MKANQSLKDFVIDLQMFADGDDLPVDDPADDIPQDDPVDDPDDDPADDPVDDPVDDQEFDEITYNKETVKIPKSERQTYLQKGYNYDKVHGKLTDHEKKLAKFQELAGVDIDQALTQLEQRKLQEEAKQYAETNGLTEEEAADRLKDKQRLQALETELKSTKRLTTLEKEKEPFKEKLYFKELEPEIDQLIAENAQKGIDISVEATYFYLRGQKLEELMSKETEKTVKSTVANIHDRARRGVVTQDSSHGDDLDTSEVDVEMAKAFGTDPKKIASYVKKQTKRS